MLLGIGDDAALLQPSNAESSLVWTTDTFNVAVHFFADDPPDAIGHKSLAVNLSDLAAMGAEPKWISLSLSMPTVDDHWLAEFSRGMFALADEFQVELVGGDTTRGPLSICITALGEVKRVHALTRGGAQLGDGIYLGGSVGDAALALKHRLGQLPAEYMHNDMRRSLHYPMPQIALGQALCGIATSAIDISDGFTQDLSHILAMSRCSARIELSTVPLSAYGKRYVEATLDWDSVLGGGDDYVLCFTMPDIHQPRLKQRFGLHAIHRVGEITQAGPIEFLYLGRPVQLGKQQGFMHFI